MFLISLIYVSLSCVLVKICTNEVSNCLAIYVIKLKGKEINKYRYLNYPTFTCQTDIFRVVKDFVALERPNI